MSKMKQTYQPGFVKKYSTENGIKKFTGWGPPVKNHMPGFSRKKGQTRLKYIDVQRKLREFGSELYIFNKNEQKPRPILIEELQEPLHTQNRIFYVCKNGHFRSSRPDRVMQGCKCLRCFGNHKLKYSIDDLRIIANQRGGVCLSDVFLGVKFKYKFRCRQGHEFETTGKVILSKRQHWCRFCAAIFRGENRRSSSKLKKKRFEK